MIYARVIISLFFMLLMIFRAMLYLPRYGLFRFAAATDAMRYICCAAAQMPRVDVYFAADRLDMLLT